MKYYIREKKDLTLTLALVVGDIGIIIISFVFAYCIRHGNLDYGISAYYKSILIVLFLWLITYTYFDLYRIRRAWRLSEIIFNSLLAIFIVMALYLAISYMLKEFFFSRLLLIYFWVIISVLIPFSRIMAKLALVIIRKKGYGARKIIIIGNSLSTKIIERMIEIHPEIGYEIIGYLTPEVLGERYNIKLENNKNIQYIVTNKIIEKLGQIKVDEVIFTISVGNKDEYWAIINSFQRKGIEVRIVPELYEIFSSRMIMDDLEGIPMIRFRSISNKTWEYTFKSIIDILGSALILIILSPIIIAIVIKMKIDYKERIIYRKDLIGKFGRPISIYRFKIPFDKEEIDSNKRKPSRFGQFIYKYSLYKIPELYNVFRGEMSLVGPSPESERRVNRYNERHRRRLSIKPGITGLAQVNGLRGFYSSDEKVQFDLKYIEEYSVLLDIKIIFQTIWAIFKRQKSKIYEIQNE